MLDLGQRFDRVVRTVEDLKVAVQNETTSRRRR